MKRPLNIAILVRRFTTDGGMERYVVETATRLHQRGHEIHLYAREADFRLLGDMHFHRVPSRYAYSSVLSTSSFARDTARLLRNRSYDCVHSHERCYSQDVLTVHCRSYKEGMSKYSRWRLDQNCLSVRNALYLNLERRQMATPWLVSVSESICEDLRRQYGRTDRVALIPPGVDTEWFAPEAVRALRAEARAREGFAEDELVVLFVGSEFRRKGLDLLIPAIGEGMRLLVVGRGDHLGSMESLAAACGVAERVRFTGLASEVRAYISAADVVVLPSRSEAFGMGILEAMACGLPVIVSAKAGVASLVKQGENGLVLNEPAELAKQLQVLRRPEERCRLGEAARKIAVHHSWDRTATAHEELYRRIRNQHRRGWQQMSGAG